VILEGGPRGLRATGVEYRTGDGEAAVAEAAKEVILSAGAVGSPQILMLSGIGPKSELEAAGVACRLDAAEVVAVTGTSGRAA
jgi:choline dehydrogenase